MNAGRHKILLLVLAVLFLMQTAFAGSARDSVDRGNRLYDRGKFNEAIKQYDQAIIDSPQALEPKFDKANSCYRLDDLGQALSLYQQVAAESKDMKLVTMAKYNLGNCAFQQGTKQKDANLKKAVEDMENAIGYWRGVLDIDPKNEKAAKNIEVARLTIKDILDQLKNQQKQQDPNQPQDPNQSKQQQQQQQQQKQQDPNQSKDPNQSQDPNQSGQQQQQQQGSKGEPNQPDEPNQPQEPNQQQITADDTAAQEILDKEQRDKQQRQILQKARYGEVDKDW